VRLPDWQTDYKLLQADFRSTPESMMTARNYASQLILRAGRSQNDTERGILLDEADMVIARGLQTDSTADPALYDLQTLSALQRRDYERAIACAGRALALDSTTRLAIHRKPIFKRNLASVYVSRGAQRINEEKLDAGVQDLQTALSLNPNSENAYINLGMVYGRQKQYQKALSAFQAAYKLNPDSQIAQQYIFHIQQALQEEEAEKADKSAQ
jgi:tetratricopeptide (TPR) repeat protein